MEYVINQKVRQILWDAILGSLGFGHSLPPYNNEVFECIPYSWEDINTYHFWHKPSGYKIYWYKYALRGASCNMDITDEQFIDILYDCLNSLPINQNPRIVYDVDRWWDVEENTE